MLQTPEELRKLMLENELKKIEDRVTKRAIEGYTDAYVGFSDRVHNVIFDDIKAILNKKGFVLEHVYVPCTYYGADNTFMLS